MLPTHWRVRPGPGVSAGLLAGGAGPRGPRAGVGWLGAGGPVPDTVGSGVQGVLKLAVTFWWAGPGPSWSHGGPGLLWACWVRGLQECGFSGVCPLLGKAGLAA